jgi:hypothetical protein
MGQVGVLSPIEGHKTQSNVLFPATSPHMVSKKGAFQQLLERPEPSEQCCTNRAVRGWQEHRRKSVPTNKDFIADFGLGF